MKNLLFFCYSLFFCSGYSFAQGALADSVHMLNYQRIQTNKAGMIALGSWGIANIAGGTIGYFSAKEKQYHYFGEMNAAWGVINTIIGGLGYAGNRREAGAQWDNAHMYLAYRSARRLFLINAGLDIVYMGGGALLVNYSDHTTSNKTRWRGYGKAIVMQGAFLFIFDNIMFASHNKNNGKWKRLMQHVTPGDQDIGFNYNF